MPQIDFNCWRKNENENKRKIFQLNYVQINERNLQFSRIAANESGSQYNERAETCFE